MNLYRTIVTVIIGCCVSFCTSCQPQNDFVQNEMERTAITPAPTPAKILARKLSKQVLNDAGWDLPDLSSFREQSREIYKANSIGKIEQTNYEPLSDVIQHADGNMFSDVHTDQDLGKKSWLIRSLKVYSANGQPFCFVMRGNRVEVDSNGTTKGRLAMSVVLIYSDQDGDGRFDAFQYSSAEAPLIPERLIKR